MTTSSKSPPAMPRINITERIAAGTDLTVEQLIEDLERYYLIGNYRFVRAAIETYGADEARRHIAELERLANANHSLGDKLANVDKQLDDARAALKLTADALVKQLAGAVELLLAPDIGRYCGYDHASTTCPMPVPCWHHRRNAFGPVVASGAHMSGLSGKITTGIQNPICGSNHCGNTDPNHDHRGGP